MAERKVTFIVGANIKQFQSQMKSVEKRFKSIGRNLKNVGTNLTQNITAPLVGLGFLSVKTAADFETLQIQLDTLTGSSKEGARAFERLKEFSAGTPFQLGDLVKANNTMLGFGMSSDEAYESLEDIGDIAAVTGGDIQSIAVAFGQSRAEGKLFTRDIRQFINQGVPAVELLANTMGVAQNEIFDLASQGKISFDTLKRAFDEATSEGGKFANGMEKQSKTISGLFSTLKDNVSISLAELGQDIVEAFKLDSLIPALTKKIQGLVKLWDGLDDRVKRIGISIAGIAAVAGPALVALGVAIPVIGSALAALSSPIGLVIAGITAIAAIIVKNWEPIKRQIVSVANYFIDLYNESLAVRLVVESISIAFKNVFSVIKMQAKNIWDVIRFLGKNIIDMFKNVGKTIKGVFTLDWDLFKEGITAGVGDLWENIKDLGSDLVDNGKDFGKEFMENFNKGMESVARGKLSLLDENSFQLFDFSGWWKDTDESVSESSGSVMQGIIDMANTINAAADKSIDKWQQFKDKFQEIGGEFKQFLAGEISTAVLSFGDALGRSLSGAENSFATTFEKIILVVLDFAKSLARLGAGIGAVMLFIPGMQAQGVGLLAASTALQALASGFSLGINKRIENREKRANQTVQKVNDAVISPSGNIISTHPEDYLIATKNPREMASKVSGSSFNEDALVRALNRVRWVQRGSDLVAVMNSYNSGIGR